MSKPKIIKGDFPTVASWNFEIIGQNETGMLIGKCLNSSVIFNTEETLESFGTHLLTKKELKIMGLEKRKAA
jgi:hypothetical protein